VTGGAEYRTMRKKKEKGSKNFKSLKLLTIFWLYSVARLLPALGSLCKYNKQEVM